MISIITPTFNQAEFISDTINCIRYEKKMLKDNLEYIIVDANSNDDTPNIIHENLDIIDVYIRENDKGQYDAINKGLKISRGEYVNWLNSDDFLLPRTLQLLDFFMRQDIKFDIISFANLNSYKEGGLFNGWGKFGRKNWDSEFKNIFKGTIIFSQESTFIRKEFLTKNFISLLSGYRNCFDHLFYMSLLRKKPKILLIDIFGGVMRVHDNSITINGSTVKDYIQKEKKVKEILGIRSYYVRKLFNSRFTKWIFPIYLLFLKLKINFKFFSIYSIDSIYIAHKVGFNLFDAESWRLKKVF
jgi:glycosyltransferase involved in cell wall biosynthesis